MTDYFRILFKHLIQKLHKVIPRDEKEVLSVKKLVYANEDEGLDAPGIDKEVDATDKKLIIPLLEKHAKELAER